MEIDKELLDGFVLMERFTITTLWSLREDMVCLKDAVEQLKEQAMYLQKIRASRKMLEVLSIEALPVWALFAGVAEIDMD